LLAAGLCGVAALAAHFVTASPTRLALASSTAAASGLLIQKLPEGVSGEAGGAVLQTIWEDLQAGLATISREQLQQRSAEELLPAVCGSHDCRLYSPAPVHFKCGCSQQRVAGLLRSLGEAEARSVLAEQGSVTITCEFCRKAYRFDAVDVEQLFTGSAVPQGTQRLN